MVEQNTDMFDEIENVAVEDWLPAGFELENPRLMNENSVVVPSNLERGAKLEVQHVDYLDDRIVLFATVSKEIKSYIYSMKAISQGEYQVLPLKAEAMYLPDYRAMQVETKRVKIDSALTAKKQEEKAVDDFKSRAKSRERLFIHIATVFTNAFL